MMKLDPAKWPNINRKLRLGPSQNGGELNFTLTSPLIFDDEELNEVPSTPHICPPLTAELLRRSLAAESAERVREKRRKWQLIAQERHQILLQKAEAAARENAIALSQIEDAVNAHYNFDQLRHEEERRSRPRFTAIQSPPEEIWRTQTTAAPLATSEDEEVVHKAPQVVEKGPVYDISALEELWRSLQDLSPALSTGSSSDSFANLRNRFQELHQMISSIISRIQQRCFSGVDEGVALCRRKMEDLVSDTRRQIENEKPKIVESPPQSISLNPEQTVSDETVASDLSPAEFARWKYEKYAAKAVEYKTAFHSLETDPSLKALKSAVLFASSNPVVICSANSPMEIIEPYRKALYLLKGTEVETNSIKISISMHPEIIHCVRYNMARKFIDLASMQIEEKNEVKLFALAALLTELWSTDKELGQVFLALLFSEFPALVPYYGKPSLRLEGNVELQLKRLGAVTKFYAAMMQTDRGFLLRRLFPTKSFIDDNPHGAEAGWELLAGLVNLDVQVGTTVLVLRNLLVTCGWLLKKMYGKQFSKVMDVIARNIMPKIREKTPKELFGPVERLNGLLDTFFQLQTIPAPDNRLTELFWNS